MKNEMAAGNAVAKQLRKDYRAWAKEMLFHAHGITAWDTRSIKVTLAVSEGGTFHESKRGEPVLLVEGRTLEEGPYLRHLRGGKDYRLPAGSLLTTEVSTEGMDLFDFLHSFLD